MGSLTRQATLPTWLALVALLTTLLAGCGGGASPGPSTSSAPATQASPAAPPAPAQASPAAPAAAASPAAASSPSAQSAPDTSVEGTVTFLGYSGEFKDNYMKAVVEPFVRKYPKIAIDYQEAQNSAAALAQARTQRNDPQVDVILMDTSIAMAGNQEGLFEKLDPKLVTNLADLYDQAKNPDGYGPAVTFDSLVLLYNTERVKPAPTSWRALWNPEYKGRVIVTAPPDIQGLAITIIATKLEGGDYQKSIDPGIALLKQLAPNVSTWTPQPNQYIPVTQGDAWIAIGWNARSQLFSEQSNGKMAKVLPQEGGIFQINTLNLVKGIKNPAAAQVFINYALSPEAQQSFSETMYYAPVNQKAQLKPETLAKTASGPEQVKSMIPVDWAYISKVRDQWNDRWKREILSGG